MATYGSGTASNSVELWNRIDGYITTTTGWSIYDTISATDYKDRVYVSDGYSGNEKIYLRMRTGVTDSHRNGLTLKRSIADGYSSSVAFNLYQKWNATANDGYGELGVFGPRVFYVRGFNTSTVFMTDFQQSSQSNWSSELIGNLSIAANTEINNTNVSSPTWDGKKFIYIPSSDYSITDRYDTTENSNTSFANPSGAFGSQRSTYGSCYVLDNSTNTEYIYGFGQSATTGAQFARLNLTSNAWQARADVPWASTSEAGKICWDGYNRLYAIRAQSTTSFAHYNIASNIWTSGAVLPFTAFRGCNLIYVPGTSTRPNRLYANAGELSGAMARLDLNADGTPSGSWVSVTSCPYGLGDNTEGGARLYYLGGDYIWAGPSRSVTSQEILRYSITNNNWTNQLGTAVEEYDNWAHVTSQGGGSGALVQNHQTYVPCGDGYSTQFWYFGDADRIAVITKDQNNVYDFIYVGMIDSYYTRQQTTLTAPLTPGIEKSVTVSDGSIFSADQKVTLSDPSGVSDFVTHNGLDGYVRRYVPSEIATIKSVNANTLVFYSISNTYASGTKVGVDTTPYGITAFRNNIIQMNNHVPKSSSIYRPPTNNNTSQSAQIYRYTCPVSTEITTQSSNEARTLQYMLWPLVVQNFSALAGDEVRGQLKGVYIVDNSGTATAGDVITFQGNTYLLFSFNSTFYADARLFAFGPLS